MASDTTAKNISIKEGRKREVAPWSRIAIVLLSLLVLCIISICLYGSIFPTTQEGALIFQNALLLIVLGSTIVLNGVNWKRAVRGFF